MAHVNWNGVSSAQLMKTAEKFLLDVKTGILEKDPVILGVLVAIVVIFITTLLFVFRRRKNLRRGVLVIGLSESGKTLLFSQLIANKPIQTYTSIKENSSLYKVPKKGYLRLIDLPGNDRLRTKFFEDFRNLARAVVIAIDSLNFPREVRDVAEFLYNIFCDPIISQNCPPFLIICNKQDLAMSKSSKVIQSQLEKEMNVLRSTQSSVLESIEGKGNNNSFLGKRGKDFQFSDLKPISVEFIEFSAKSPEENSLQTIKDWLARVA